MIELLVTSFPVVIRWFYLRWRGLPITLVTMYRAVFSWLVLALIVFFTAFYYHPKSYTGIVPFRIVPVVSDTGGTVTAIHVENGDRVEAGALLFEVDSRTQRASLKSAEARLAEIDPAITAASAQKDSASAAVDAATSLEEQAELTLQRQEQLRESGSTAFRQVEYDRALNTRNARRAEKEAAIAQLAVAAANLDESLPAQRETAVAALEEAQTAVDKTEVRAVSPRFVERMTLFPGARAGQTALAPAMIIIPDRVEDFPVRIVAGFEQVTNSVLKPGLAAEVACETNFNAGMVDVVLPARVVIVQRAIAAGQFAPTGRLVEPSDLAGRGSIFAYLELVHKEHEKLLFDGAGCMVQGYTTHVTGSLEGTPFAHVIETLGVLKAILLRIKVWVALAAGVGLGGGGH